MPLRKDVKKRATVAGLILEGYSDEEIHNATNAGWDLINECRNNLPDELWHQVHDWIPPEDIENCNIQQLIQRNLETGIKAQIRIAHLTNDTEWLQKQSAADLATFYSDLSDKSIRLLAAQQRAAERGLQLLSGGTSPTEQSHIQMEEAENGSHEGSDIAIPQGKEGASPVTEDESNTWEQEIYSLS